MTYSQRVGTTPDHMRQHLLRHLLGFGVAAAPSLASFSACQGLQQLVVNIKQTEVLWRLMN